MLTMPKFESELDLVDTLSTMGMSDAFDELAADFCGMDGHSCLAGDPLCLYVSNVIHKAFVLVDEEGTEAAAATVVVAVPSSGSEDITVEVTVNRPFIFLIRDKATGAILFLGWMVDPSKQDVIAIRLNYGTKRTAGLNCIIRARLRASMSAGDNLSASSV